MVLVRAKQETEKGGGVLELLERERARLLLAACLFARWGEEQNKEERGAAAMGA